MKSYLEIKVPISHDEYWFEELRDLLEGVDIKWQQGYYHITMAFLDITPEGVNLIPGLAEILDEAKAPSITFDKLDAFSSGSHRQVVHLTTTNAPEEFLTLVENIRRYFKRKGCVIQSDFRLHVTLGRVHDPKINVHKLLDIIDQAQMPTFTMKLTEVEYRIFRGKTLGKWKLLS